MSGISMRDRGATVGSESAERMVEIYHNAATWVIGHAMECDRGMPEIEGWIVYRGYLNALGIDMQKILRRIAREEIEGAGRDRDLAYWREAICRCAFDWKGGLLLHAYPGEEVPADVEGVNHVEFRAHPRWLPFGDIVKKLECLARERGISLREVLFKYRGVWIRDGATLSNLIRSRKLDPQAVGEALDRWRDGLMARLSSPRGKEKSSLLDDVPEVLHGRFLTRPQLARVLKRKTRTLVRWDRAGFTPTGTRWCPGLRVSANVVLYDLVANWKAICQFIGRDRDHKKDRCLAEELGHLATVPSKWFDQDLHYGDEESYEAC